MKRFTKTALALSLFASVVGAAKADVPTENTPLYTDTIRLCQPDEIKYKVNDIDLRRLGPTYTGEMWFYKEFKGEACLETRGEKSFKVDWNQSAYGFLHEVGLYGLNVPVDKVNKKGKAKFDLELKHISGGGGYTGLYGWFGKPASPESVEFYVNENWSGLEDKGVKGPKEMGDCIHKGTIKVDGRTYEVYVRPRQGDRFEQWWSNATEKRNSGKISYAKHFKAWRKGMPDVTLTRMSFAYESRWGKPSAGTVEYKSFKIDKP
jgi:Glycosyl hydrolases family 11